MNLEWKPLVNLMDTPLELSLWEALGQDSPGKTFSSVYQGTSRLVWTVCFRILKSQEDASDAYQGAYARLFQLVRQEDCPPKGHSVESLMMRLAVLEADRLRKQRTRRQNREVAVENYQGLEQGTSAGLEEQLAHQQLREKLELVIEELPENLRVPVVLHYLDGIPQKQIAQALGVSPVAVNKRLKRALEELRPKCRRAGLKELTIVLAAVAGIQTLLSPPAALAESVVLQGALQASQGAGLGSISLSSLEPVKGTALLGGKAIIATVASLVVIVSLTLVGAINGKAGEKVNPSVEAVSALDTTTEQTSINIENHQSDNKASENNPENGSVSTTTKVVEEPAAIAEIETVMLKVLWKETDEPVEGVTFSYEGLEKEIASDDQGMIKLENGLEEGVEVSLNHPEAMLWNGKLPESEEAVSTVYLEKAGTLSGVVAYGDGGKLAGNKQVRLYYDHPDCGTLPVKIAETTTDSKGQYHLPVQKLGALLVRANDGVYIDRTEYGTKLELNASKPGEMIEAPLLLLEQGATIYGKVTTSTGKPIKDAEVKLDFQDDLTVLTNADGEYQISPLFPDSYRVRITNTEYVPYQVTIDLGERESREVSPTLEEGAKLKVIVLDAETGDPVAGSRATNINEDYRHVVKEGNVAGELLVWGLEKNTVNDIYIGASGYKSDHLNFAFPPDSDNEEKFVTLKKNPDAGKIGAISGVVYANGDIPVEDAKVYLGQPWYTGTAGSTENDGSFYIEKNTKEANVLIVQKNGYQCTYVESPTLGTPELPAKHKIILTPGHWIEFTVKDEVGNSLPEAKVSFRKWYKGVHQWSILYGVNAVVPQAVEATHRYKDLPDEKLKVSVSISGYSDFEGEFEVDKHHEITLIPPGVIIGEVVDAETQKPIEEFTISYYKSSGFEKLISDPDGIFVLKNKSLGESHFVCIKAKGYTTYENNITATKVDDDKVFRVEMQKPNLTTILVIDNETGQPLSGVPVGTVLQNWAHIDWERFHQFNDSAVTDENGMAFINSSHTEGVVVIPAHKDYAREVIVFKEKSENLTISLKKGCQIKVTLDPVLRGDYEEISISSVISGRVQAKRIHQSYGNQTIASDGITLFKNLAPGVYHVGVYRWTCNTGTTHFSKKVHLTEYGETVEITLGDKMGSSRLYGKLLYNGKIVPSEGIGVKANFATNNQNAFGTITESDGGYEFKFLDDGEYTISVDYKIGESYSNRIKLKRNVLVQTNTEYNIELSDQHQAVVAFTLGKFDQQQGFTIQHVSAVVQESHSVHSLNKEDSKWILTDDVNGEMVFSVVLAKGDVKKAISLEDQPVMVDTMSGSCDLGTLMVRDTGSVTLDLTFSGIDQSTPSEAEITFLAMDSSMSEKSKVFTPNVAPDSQGTQVTLHGFDQGDYTISAAGGFHHVGDPTKVSVTPGQATNATMQLAPCSNILSVLEGDFEVNIPKEYLPTRYLVTTDNQTREIIPEWKKYENSMEAGADLMGKLNSNKGFAVNGYFFTPVANEGPHTLVIEFEKYQSVTKEIDKAGGINEPIVIPVHSLKPK